MLARSHNVNNKMEILLELTSNKLMVNPHGFEGIFKDGDGVLKLKNFKEVSVTLNTERLSRSDEVLKLKNFKKDASLKLSSYQIKKGMSMSGSKSHKFTRLQSLQDSKTKFGLVDGSQADCDIKATNIILQGLPANIYSLVNHDRVAKDLWERVQLLMQGTSLTKQERECKLYNAFDKFTHIKGESLHMYYLRFTQLINDMNIYKMKMEQFQVNTKFLNSLPPEWRTVDSASDPNNSLDASIRTVTIFVVMGVALLLGMDHEGIDRTMDHGLSIAGPLLGKNEQTKLEKYSVSDPGFFGVSVTKLTTGRLVNGSSCDGIDMVIKNLDLELKLLLKHLLHDVVKQSRLTLRSLQLNMAYPIPLNMAYPVLCPIQRIHPNRLIRPWTSSDEAGMDNDLFTYKVDVANIPCNSVMEDETDDDIGYDPSDVAFIEWLRSKIFNYKMMDQYTMKALRIYWIRGDDEVELTDEESSDDEDEIAEVFRIDTNIFDYETPICSAFNEFNYLLKDYEWYEALDDYNGNKELCEIHEPPVCNIKKYMMIKYSFNDDEEYVAVKEDEYDDLIMTRRDACQAYQEIFRIMDEGWMVTRAT
ncbi:hypothetical protein Tco_0340061 [Tanacetum coccineum]